MGVTKQAAQKRFVPKGPGESAPLDPGKGFGLFTTQARNVVVSAQQEAHGAGNDQIGLSHLVLGLLQESGALAAQAIRIQGVTLEAVREAATATLPPAAAEPPDLVPFDAQARKALELTYRQVLRLGHTAIGPEHILLAILELEDGAGVLAGLGVDRPAAESHIVAATGSATVGSVADEPR